MTTRAPSVETPELDAARAGTAGANDDERDGRAGANDDEHVETTKPGLTSERRLAHTMIKLALLETTGRDANDRRT